MKTEREKLDAYRNKMKKQGWTAYKVDHPKGWIRPRGMSARVARATVAKIERLEQNWAPAPTRYNFLSVWFTKGDI